MDEQRLQACLELIQGLLSCGNDEELSQLVHENLELIDPEFLQVCEQEARQLREAGRENDARFLTDVAQQLAQWLNQSAGGNASEENLTSEDYRRFLQEVLQTIGQSQGDANVVYPLLQQNLEKLDGNLVQILQAWATPTLRESKQKKNIAAVILTFGNLIAEFPLGSRADNLEIAIAAYEQALQVFTRSAFPQGWAGTQYNLGLAYYERIKGERGENLEEAIAAYQLALQVRTRSAFPQQWATTQVDLGIAYSNRIKGERGENLEQAIAAYQLALQVFTRDAFSQKWAITQNNLGIAYYERIKGERAENLEEAIAAFQLALQVYTRDAFPQDWARTQVGLGNAYSDRIKGERAENLEEAIAYFEQALQVYTRDAFPQQWARTQVGLGIAYSNRIKGERRENLEEAIAVYEQALQVYTRNAFPQQWANTQNGLGSAYGERIKGETAENLEEAIAAFQLALQVYTRDAFPQDWARTQVSLGEAYRTRIKGERRENLEEAIAAYKQALQVYTRDAFPQDWARTQVGLGNAYGQRIKGERAENLEEAIAAYKQALQVLTRSAFSQDWAMTQNNLGHAYSERIKGERGENLEQAIAAYKQALQVRTREAFPQDWAMTQNNLGNAYLCRIKGERRENLEEAIAAYQLALQVLTRQAFPQQWAMTQNNLGNAYSARIKGERGENLELAIAYLEQALQVYTPSSFPVECLKTGRNLGNLAYDLEDWETASFGYDRAIQAVEQSRDWATSAQTKRELLTDALPIYGEMVECCINLEQYDRALLTVERSKSRTLIELLNEADLEPKNATEEQLQRYRQLRREIAALQQSFEGEDNFSDNRPSEGRGAESSRKKEALQALLNERNNLLAEIDDPDFNAVQKISQKLPDFTQLLTPETVLIEWYLPLDPDLGAYAFLVTLQNNQPHIQYHRYSPEQREALDQFNQSYFSDYRDPTWYDQLDTRLDELAQLLDLSQLLQNIPTHCNSAILVPHLYLHLFPLHALAASRSNGQSAPLQDWFSEELRYAPSCQILEYLQNRPPRAEASHFFAIQNPTQDLFYTDLEVETIGKNFDPNCYIFKNQEATKQTLNRPETRDQMRGSRYVHFACHGGFDAKNPLNSALILAGDRPTESEERSTLTLRDGRRFDTDQQGLTLKEIYSNLELNACRLVMLSACETGLLSAQLTDEYVGLASGFFYAGSPSVVSSLWCVDDFATAVLAIRFYQEFTPETSVAKALKNAQNWMRTVSRTDFLNWCRTESNLSKKNAQRFELSLRQGTYQADYPFAERKYWSAFNAIGL
jgi:CHAT domain-containing protein